MGTQAQAQDTFRLTNFAVAAGSLFFTIAAWSAWYMFKPFVPALLIQIWLTGTILFMLSWYALVTVFLIRQPDEEERRTVWYQAQLYVRIGSNLVVLATIWLFFPHAPRELQLVMTIFYVAHVPTQILALPQRGLINAAGTFVILGSVAIVHLISGGQYAEIIAGFVLAFATVMIMLGRAEGSTIDDVLAERRKSEEAARKLARALASVAEERDAKTRFIAIASHDLGQPIQAASLFFDQTMRAPDPSTRERAADGARKAFAAADQLLSHMLNHLRLEADAVDPHFANVALGPLMSRVATQFEPAASEAGIFIAVAATRRRARLDRALLERALGNLVSNAIVHSGCSKLLIGVRQHGENQVRLWVIDNGVGISQVDAGRIFDDYYRGTDTQAAVKSGFGLGLASVRRIVALMDGSAGLDPRWLNGSAFYLQFPFEASGQDGHQVAERAL